MTRLEIIHLRTAEGFIASLTRQIREAIGPEGAGAGVVPIFRRNGHDTDVAIHINSHESGEDAGPSAHG